MAGHAPITSQAQVLSSDLLQWRRQQLRSGGSAADLNWLLQFHADLSWQDLQLLPLHPERLLQLRVPLEEISTLWQRHHSGHEPLQYLVGRCPWRDLELQVAPGVLIPRQETELLVDLALNLSDGTAPRIWADLGTGSGCLALALALAWPNSKGLAVDVSGTALAQARTNLLAHQRLEQVELRQGNWWEALRPEWGQLDVVVANPPYIPDPIWHDLDPVVRDHEPRLALSSGPDGLDAIRVISAGAAAALAPGGWLLVEHHHDQSAAALQLLQQAGLEQVHAHADLEGTARFAVARKGANR